MQRILFLILLSLELLELGYCGRCPNTWLERPSGTSCYKLWPNAKKTWDEARRTCQLLNADLLKLNAKEEKDWVIGEVKKYSPDLEWWIGLKRHGEDENKWVWADGETRNESNKFILWGSGEPNNHMKSEDCAEIWDNLLNDKNCDTPLQFICEQSIDTPRPCDMASGWDDIYPGNNCYKVFNQKMTALEASGTCSMNNATVLSISDDSEQFIFSDYITETNSSTWMDLKALQGFDGSYAWHWQHNGQQEINSPYWMDGQPDWNRIESNRTFCTKMSPSLSQHDRYKTWEPTSCEEQNNVVCEKIPIECPPSYYKFTLFKCLTFAFEESLMQWNDARGYCNLRGTTLLEIKSQYEMNELDKLISNVVIELSLRSTIKLWLGLTVNGPDRVWDSGAPVGDLENKMLAMGGVTNETYGCGFLEIGDTIKWKVGGCDEDMTLVCTIPGNQQVKTPSSRKPRYVCQDDYEVVENTCIRRYYGEATDWFSGRRICQQYGADLATVYTSKKLKFLKDKALGTMWLGLNDLQQEGQFFWSDETTEYGGEMDKVLNANNYKIGDRYSENCVALVEDGGDSKLVDIPCSFKNSFYCQVWAEWNIAFGKNARQSSDYGDHRLDSYGAEKAIDGCTKSSFSNLCCTHTLTETTPWWELDLGTVYPIRKVIIYRRYEEGCPSCKKRMHNFRLFISNVTDATDNPVFQDRRVEPTLAIILVLPEIKYGRYVRIDVPNSNQPFSLCEVEIFSEDLSKMKNDKILTEQNSNCYLDSKKWKGNIRHGISGRLCQEWVLNTPHEHTRHTDSAFPDGSQKEASNYCRDPDGEGRPWCYTVDPSVRWEYCPIPHCNTIVPDAKLLSTPIPPPPPAIVPDSKLLSTPIPPPPPGAVSGISKEELAVDCGSSDWLEDGTGTCYQIHGQYTAEDAKTFCRAAGGELAIPRSVEEQTFLVDMISNKTIDSLFWLGLSYSTVFKSWQTVDQSKVDETFINSMINKDDIISNIPSGTACIGIDYLGKGHALSKWGFDKCLNRHHFICRKDAKYSKFFTPDDKEVTVMNNEAIKLSDKTDLTFEFKGKSGARIIMKNTAVKSQIPVEIIIGFDKNTRSKIVTKYQSVNGFPAPISESKYSKFWISWAKGRIQIGEGGTIGEDVFLTGGLSPFSGFDYMSLSVSGQDVGYWKFPRGVHTGSKRRNLALKKKTWQSSTYSDISSSDRGVDGCSKNAYKSECCMHTDKEYRPWWEVDLGAVYDIGEIVMTKRWACESCRSRMNEFYVHIDNAKISDAALTEDTIRYVRKDQEALPVVRLKTPGAKGRFVLIELPDTGVLEFCELEIYEDVDAELCNKGWLSYDSHTCFYFGTMEVSWETARSKCKEKDPDSDLAVISTPQQEMFVYEKATELNSFRFWFGLKDTLNGGISWWNGQSSNYSRLTSGKDQKNGQGNCFMTTYNDPDVQGWAQQPCSIAMNFICSKSRVEPKTTTVITTVPTTTITTTWTTQPATRPLITTLPPQMTTVTSVGTKTTLNAVTSQANKGTCPSGWSLNPSTSSCIYVGRKSGYDFLAAQVECLKMQSRLGSITSAAEQTFYFDLLFDHVKEEGKFTKNWDGFWIGGLDVQTEGFWKWFLYDEPWFDINWSRGQPDNYNSKEDCLMLRTHLSHLGDGNDAPCEHKVNGFMCKKYLNDWLCDDGWYYDPRTQYCYLVQQDLKTWSQARAVCTGNHSADLASIVNAQEQEFLAVILSADQKKDQFYWVGANTDPKDDTWWWSDKSTWWMRIDWHDFVVDPNKHCGAVTGTKTISDKALLSNENCDQQLPYVCKKRAVNPWESVTEALPSSTYGVVTGMVTPIVRNTTILPSTAGLSTAGKASNLCGEGWEKRPNSKYCYKFGVDVQPWMKAKEICRQSGGTLASITTDEEQHYIAGRLNGMGDLPLRMWIGANDKQFEGKWTWTDGSPFAFFNWKSTEPDDYDNSEDCGAMITTKALSFGENFGLWNDGGCESPQGYICKRTALELSTVPQTTVTQKAEGGLYGCTGNGWVDYQNSCYLFVQESTTWRAASTECRLQGGDLASISNILEQEFVFSQLPQDLYCFNIWENDTECSIWARRGECTRNPIWMATHCHQACNLCQHNCRDRYVSSEKCLEWFALGECDLNPTWMKENCAASCGICKGAPTRGFWIGMYSSKGSHEYVWNDGSDVTFTNWDFVVKQPKYFAYIAGSCVGMFIQTGTWNDGPCKEILQGYICEKPKEPVSTTTISPFKVGCIGDNSVGYESYCYTYVKEQKTFSDAQDYCVDNGGHLAYIKDRYVQSFVSSELLNQLQDYWIGLSFEGDVLKWADKQDASRLKFINFAKSFNPVDSLDCCFALTTYKPIGLWKDHNCTDKLPFVCQSLRDGYTVPPTTTPTTTVGLPCISGWMEYDGNCYYFPDEEVSWYQARLACSRKSATLVSIESSEENQFINNNMLEVTWLGLHDTGNEGTFVWVDGKPFIFANWDEDEPNNAGDEDCSTMVWSGKWNDLPCENEKYYICKTPKGKQQETTLLLDSLSTTTQPTTPNMCGDDEGWKYFNSFCYKVIGSKASWFSASRMCRDYGGHLISIHSSPEQNFINELISGYDDVIWTGFNDLDVNGVFRWNDGTPTDFTRWYPGQPNDGGGGEKCVAIDYNHDGQWHDYPCRDDLYVMCKRPQGAPTTVIIPTTIRPGGCAPDFKEFGSKCYYVGGLDGTSLKFWSEADQFCRTKQASLTSIHSAAENAFITSLLIGARVQGFWTGLNDLTRQSGEFDWADNSEVDFTNWDENEPSSTVYYYNSEYCVELFARQDKAGLWNDAVCNSLKGYICSAFKSEDFPTAKPDLCPSGFKSHQGHCYKVLIEPSSWDSSQTQCASEGGYLVTLGTVYEKAFLQTLLKKDIGSIWVGMKLHRYGEDKWVNREPVTLPDLQDVLSNNSVGCISLEGSSWKIEKCKTQHNGVCEVNPGQTTVVTTPAEEKICSNKKLFLHDGYCYYLSDKAANFETANRLCMEKNMTFVSIHGYKENEALANKINETIYKTRIHRHYFYIGMYFENRRDQFPKWVDHTSVNYLQVTPVFYDLRNSHNGETLCFAFNTRIKDRKTWDIIDCKQQAGYICKMKADAPQTTVTTTTSTTTSTSTTTTMPTTTTTPYTTSTVAIETTSQMPGQYQPNRQPYRTLMKDDGLSPGQIAAIVVGIMAFVLVVLVVGYLFRAGYMRKYLYPVQNNSGIGFDNALFHKGEDCRHESVNFD